MVNLIALKSDRKWCETTPIRPIIASHLANVIFQNTTFLVSHFGSVEELLCPWTFASSTLPLLPCTSPEWTFLPTHTLILLPDNPSLWDGLLPHHQQNKCRWSHLHELWTGPSWRSPWFHALDLVAWSCCSLNMHLHNLFTNSQWVPCHSVITRPSRIYIKVWPQTKFVHALQAPLLHIC